MSSDSFFVQFLSQTWRLWAAIVVMLVIAFIAYRRSAKQAQEEFEKRKEAVNPQDIAGEEEDAQESPTVEPLSVFPEDDFDDDFVVSSGGSIFDDEGFFDEEDVPVQSVQETTSPPDEEAVDLASLLSGMVEQTEEPKAYHLISDRSVAVKLVTGKHAIGRELLCILRDERDSRLMVQIGDMGYRTLENDKSAKKEFALIMKEMSGIILASDETAPDDVDVSDVEFNKMSPKSVDVQISSGGDTTAREMISILRDETDEHLIIQIGNTGYRTLADHAKAKAGFNKIMKELSTSVTTPDDNPPIVPKKSKPVTPPVAPVSSIFNDMLDAGEEEVDLPPGVIRPPKMDDMPDAYSVDRFGRVKVNKVRLEDRVEDINIADAIETYLQHKIEQTPEFQNRRIHIRQASGGGVKIEVDGASYEFVDEVADPEARAFIKEAIDEWQEQH